jgi:MFS family permease
MNISLKQYSLLWSINGALIVLGQPLISGLVKWFKTLKSQMIAGMVIFIGSFAAAASAEQFSAFIAAMVILTIGEMLIWPAVPTIANQLAPKGREGFYQGIVNSTATGGRMIGPLLGGILVDLYGISVLFAVLMVLYVFAIMTTLVYDRKLKESKELAYAS